MESTTCVEDRYNYGKAKKFCSLFTSAIVPRIRECQHERKIFDDVKAKKRWKNFALM